jgi:hypothetical protein
MGKGSCFTIFMPLDASSETPKFADIGKLHVEQMNQPAPPDLKTAKTSNVEAKPAIQHASWGLNITSIRAPTSAPLEAAGLTQPFVPIPVSSIDRLDYLSLSLSASYFVSSILRFSSKSARGCLSLP